MERKLVYYGHETLRMKASEIEVFSSEISDIAASMHSVMKKSKGIGLAAPQIALPVRMVVIDLSQMGNGPVMSLVNPVVSKNSADPVLYEEGCLSIPGIFQDVLRPEYITVHAYSVDGKSVSFDADGILSRVLQHEIDHLDGILFIDKIEEHLRLELTGELKKIRRKNR